MLFNMNKILRIVVGAIALLILILAIVGIASKRTKSEATPTPPQVETPLPTVTPSPTVRPTRTPMPSPAAPPTPARTIDPSSGTNLPKPSWLPSTYSNIPAPEDG